MSRPDPTRMTELVDGSEDLETLQSGVRMLRRQNGSPAQTQALAARLGPELTSNVVAGSALLSSALLRFVLVGAGVIGVGLGAYWHSNRNAAEIAARPPVAHVAPVDRAQPIAAAPPVALAADEPAEVRAVAAPEQAAPAAAQRLRADKPKASAADPEAELVLLGRAQALLDSDPNGALDVLAEHARSFAQGVFSEEREVLALEAESKLGHKALARARAERFMAKFPRSAHARRVRTLLEPMR